MYTFDRLSNEDHPVKNPCSPPKILVFEEELLSKDYHLIGICAVKGDSGGLGNKLKNQAFDKLIKGSCKNGGELIKIVSHEEVLKRDYGTVLDANMLSGFLNSKRVAQDKILAEIYVKKN